MLKRDDKPVCLPSHGENRGSSPLGSANVCRHLAHEENWHGRENLPSTYHHRPVFCRPCQPTGTRFSLGVAAPQLWRSIYDTDARIFWLSRHFGSLSKEPPQCLRLPPKPTTPTYTTGEFSSDDALRAERALTIGEFCAIENFSKGTYYKMKRSGLGPEETVIPIPGMNVIRISADARRAWHAKLAAANSNKAMELERARKQAQRVAAGKLAAKSAKHVSQTNYPRRRRRVRAHSSSQGGA
jgi:hypothetical protein